MATLTAVPGAAWPGSIWPADPITASVATFNPVIFSLVAARNGSGHGQGGVLTQPAASTQYVQAQITATLDGSPYSPASDPVQVAFVPAPAAGLPANPTSGQWQTAGWETDPGPAYWASVLTGPANGGITLTAGTYAIAVKVTDNPAVPVLWGPYLIIT